MDPKELLDLWNDYRQDKRILLDDAAEDYDSWTVIEFGENGDAYPHGIGGTLHVPYKVWHG